MSQPVLTTDALTLRPWSPDDDADVHAALDIYSRNEVAQWLGQHPAPWADADMAHARLLRWQATARENPGLGIWAVVPTGEQRPVGSALLVRLPDGEGHLTDDVEVGWHLHPDSWGRGYATRSARRLLDHGRDTLGLGTVHAVAYEGNDASVAVMRRLGMQARGETDRWYGVRLQWWSIELD